MYIEDKTLWKRLNAFKVVGFIEQLFKITGTN